MIDYPKIPWEKSKTKKWIRHLSIYNLALHSKNGSSCPYWPVLSAWLHGGKLALTPSIPIRAHCLYFIHESSQSQLFKSSSNEFEMLSFLSLSNLYSIFFSLIRCLISSSLLVFFIISTPPQPSNHHTILSPSKMKERKAFRPRLQAYNSPMME